MEDFVRQIQRYRLAYATALFASIGWILGQLVDPSRATLTLDEIRARGPVAGVILLVPMLNGLFFILMMEAARQVQSLARYRFLLACRIGAGVPVWRWELFKATPEGSIRSWTNPSNIFIGVMAVFLSLGAFWFVGPAVALYGSVRAMRWFSGIYTAALATSVIVAGWKRRTENEVADEPTGVTYRTLRPSWADRAAAAVARDESSDSTM